MRCLTLAEALHAGGADVLFVCREHPGHGGDVIRERGFDLALLPRRESAGPAAAGYAGWIGDSFEGDARSTADAIGRHFGKSDWVVADHYAFGAAWEQAVRPVAGRVMAIDDMANRRHDCDLLLDQNMVEDFERRYDDKVPADCERLLGPAYAMLQARYATVRRTIAPRRGPVRRILVAFGGADGCHLTMRVAASFTRLARPGTAMDVVAHRNNPDAGALARLAAASTGLRVLTDLPSLADAIAAADAGFGATGATTWERCCLGLPSVVITMGENQRPIAETLDRLQIVRWLGDEDRVSDEAMDRALGRLLDEPLDGAWSERCMELVDGHGVDRVRLSLVTPLLACEGMHVRRADARDADLLRTWRNDPETIAASRESRPVEADEHARWLRATLDHPDRRLFIVHRDGVPLGTVRVDRRPGGQEVSWTVAPHARGMGVGKTMVKLIADALVGDVYADVKPGNEASAAVAVHAGLTRESSQDGLRRFTRPALGASTH